MPCQESIQSQEQNIEQPPGANPEQNSIQNPDETLAENPDQNPNQNSNHTTGENPDVTPGENPNQNRNQTPGETPDVAPGKNPINSPDKAVLETPGQTVLETPGQTVLESPDQNFQWFVLRDISRSNSKSPAYLVLEKENVNCFIPMHYVLKQKGGKRVRCKVPVISNLLFAYAGKDDLDKVLSFHPTIQFRFEHGKSIKNPMTVRKADMDRFIKAVESSSGNPVYFTPEEITSDKFGKEVRIIGGNLDGYSGHLLKTRGSKVKRLLVDLQGYFTAAVEVDAEYVQFI